MQQLHKLQGRWNEGLKRELGHKESERLQRRWHSGVKQLQQLVERLQHDAERAHMDTLAQAAGLCGELENGIENTDPALPDSAVWEQRWVELQLPADAAPGLRRRFDLALQTLNDDDKRKRWLAELESNARRRAELCLQLEVLAGIDSPPEAAQERLALQVSRLAGHLSEGEAAPLIALPNLELDWYQGGPAPAAQSAALETRFRHALEAALPQTGLPGEAPGGDPEQP